MLIEGWKKSYKLFSVQMLILLGFVSELYNYLPILQEYLPHNYVGIASGLIILARVIKQTQKQVKEDAEAEAVKISLDK